MALFSFLKDKIKKARENFLGKIEDTIKKDEKNITSSTLDELFEVLISADISVDISDSIIEEAKEAVRDGRLKTKDDLLNFLREKLYEILKKWEVKKVFDIKRPFVISILGVNGTGKTTTAAKIAKMLIDEGESVLFAAADTFRAAAIEQLQFFAEALNCDIVKHKMGADPAAVAHDALKAAKARKRDVVIIDTAGRLHTKRNLISELKKLYKVCGREVFGAPHESILVIDALMGQNVLNQAEVFKKEIGVSSIAITKMDSTSKGGTIITVSEKLGIPIKFLGVGEGIDDIRIFEAKSFIDALIPKNMN